ncbi:NAD(P)H-binding protein [Kribbella sp. NPDC006257]|uniref:NmrA family NAD(P)-binding protein n=1 Tax=Kribbella sp. NPDC006257 TaxID=3156738 RepID=UPI00339F812F
MTILVTGASGNAGGAVVAALAAEGLPGRALVRKEVELPAGIEAVYGDLNQADTFSLAGVTGIFLLSGYDRVEELLAKAAGAGVRRIALLSSSSIAGKSTDNAVAAYHLAAERAVIASGLEWTFLRPNSFMSNTLRWRDQLRAGDVVRVQFPDVPISTIHPLDIGEVAVRAMAEDGHAGTAYRLTGPVALKPAEQVEILGQALGRKLVAQELSREESHQELFASMPAPYAEAIEGFFADGNVDETSVTDAVETVTGHPPRTLQEWVRENAALFTDG